MDNDPVEQAYQAVVRRLNRVCESLDRVQHGQLYDLLQDELGCRADGEDDGDEP